MKATVFDGKTVTPYDPADSQVVSASTPYAWVDVVPASNNDPEVIKLLQQMGFTDIVANYTTRPYASGMFQVFGDNMLGSTYAAGDNEGDPELVHCVWNAGCFITIRQGADQAIADALADFRSRAPQLFAEPGPVPGILMQLILDSINRQITDLQEKVGLLDGQIIVTANSSQLTQLQKLRAPVEALGIAIPPYLENLNESLVDPQSLPGMNPAGVQALQTYSACANDVAQRITSLAGDVRSAIQDYQGQVASAQGNRINQLTLVSTIFLPITFMTGYFGMNFQWLTNSTMSFVSWLAFGLALPIVAVVASTWLLRRGGFQIANSLGFHLRHKPHRPSDSAAPKP